MKLFPQACWGTMAFVSASMPWCQVGAFLAPSRPPVLITDEKFVTTAGTRQAIHKCRGVRPSTVGNLAAEKEEDKSDEGAEQEPMDLDLSQMFEVFEAADREIKDEAVGKKPTSEGSNANEPLSLIKDIFGADLPWSQSKGKNSS